MKKFFSSMVLGIAAMAFSSQAFADNLYLPFNASDDLQPDSKIIVTGAPTGNHEVIECTFDETDAEFVNIMILNKGQKPISKVAVRLADSNITFGDKLDLTLANEHIFECLVKLPNGMWENWTQHRFDIL